MNKFSSVIYAKLLANPPFSIDIFLAITLGVLQCLLIYEIINLERRTQAKANFKMKIKHSAKDLKSIKNISTCSSDSPATAQNSSVCHFSRAWKVYQQKPEETSSCVQCYSRLLHPMPWPLTQMHGTSDIARVRLAAQGTSNVKLGGFNRLSYLLSVSPSEYVRRDREWIQTKKQKLSACMEMLTANLEQALRGESLNTQNLYKNAIRKSINTLRTNFLSQVNNSSYHLDRFSSKNFPVELSEYDLRSSKSNDLIMSICHASNMTNISRIYNDGDGDNEQTRCKSEYDIEVISSTLSIKSSESILEVLKKQSDELFVNFNFQ